MNKYASCNVLSVNQLASLILSAGEEPPISGEINIHGEELEEAVMGPAGVIMDDAHRKYI